MLIQILRWSLLAGAATIILSNFARADMGYSSQAARISTVASTMDCFVGCASPQ